MLRLRKYRSMAISSGTVRNALLALAVFSAALSFDDQSAQVERVHASTTEHAAVTVTFEDFDPAAFAISTFAD